jgi:outer membrane protein assembly factor BamA
MKRLTVHILLNLLTVVGVSAVELVWRGDHPVNAKQIERLMAAQSSDLHRIDTAAVLLRDFGYLDATVRSKGDSLIIESGPRFRLARIAISGDSTFKVNGGGFFSRTNIRDQLADLIDILNDRGYHFASMQITGVHRDRQSVNLDINLNRGPVVTVSEMRYVGLVRSNPAGIERSLPVRRGDTLTSLLLRSVEAAADELDHVVFLPPVRVQPQAGYATAALEFRFVERKQFHLEGSGGYIPDAAIGLVWSLQAAFTNLFGEGRQAWAHSERSEKGRNSLKLKYRQPMFLAGAGRLGFEVSTRDYRDQFYEFYAGADYTARLAAGWEGGLGLSYKSVTPDDDRPSFTRYAARLSSAQRSLYPRQNPTGGWALSWSLTYAHRRYRQDSLIIEPEQRVLNDTRAAVAVQTVYSLWGRVVTKLGINYLGYLTDEPLPPISELYLIGGPGSLRGYRNENFSALHAVIATLEPRFRFDSGYLYLFHDGAYLNNRVRRSDSSIVTEERYRYGYGVGLAVMEPGRRLRLSLGWNPEFAFDQPRLSIEFSADI